MSQQTVSSWEAGVTVPAMNRYADIERAYELPEGVLAEMLVTDLPSLSSRLTMMDEQIVTVFAELTALKREVRTLRRGDIDEEASTITVERAIYRISGGPIKVKGTKTGAEGTLAVPPALVAALLTHRGLRHSDDYVFTDDPYGKIPWLPDTVTHQISHHVVRLGLSASLTRGNNEGLDRGPNIWAFSTLGSLHFAPHVRMETTPSILTSATLVCPGRASHAGSSVGGRSKVSVYSQHIAPISHTGQSMVGTSPQSGQVRGVPVCTATMVIDSQESQRHASTIEYGARKTRGVTCRPV